MKKPRKKFRTRQELEEASEIDLYEYLTGYFGIVASSRWGFAVEVLEALTEIGVLVTISMENGYTVSAQVNQKSLQTCRETLREALLIVASEVVYELTQPTSG